MLLVLAVKVGSLPTHCANGKFVLRTGFEPMSPAVCLIYTTYLCRCLNHLTNETYGGGQGTRTLKPLARLGSFQDCCLTIRLTLHRCFPPYRCRKTYTNKICYGNLYSALSFISAIRPDDTFPNTWFHSYAISELISDVLIGGGMVWVVGLEPTRDCSQQILSLCCLPIPTYPHMARLEGLEPSTYGVEIRYSILIELQPHIGAGGGT